MKNRQGAIITHLVTTNEGTMDDANRAQLFITSRRILIREIRYALGPREDATDTEFPWYVEMIAIFLPIRWFTRSCVAALSHRSHEAGCHESHEQARMKEPLPRPHWCSLV